MYPKWTLSLEILGVQIVCRLTLSYNTSIYLISLKHCKLCKFVYYIILMIATALTILASYPGSTIHKQTQQHKVGACSSIQWALISSKGICRTFTSSPAPTNLVYFSSAGFSSRPDFSNRDAGAYEPSRRDGTGYPGAVPSRPGF